MIERERKFKINKNILKFIIRELVKKLGIYDKLEITQIYLEIEKTKETRIRRIFDTRTGSEKFTRTVKIGKGETREEFEESITREEFEKLSSAGIKTIQKTRYNFHHNISEIKEIIVDVYNNKSFAILEVEYDNEKIPSIIEEIVKKYQLEDVTLDESYKNKNL